MSIDSSKLPSNIRRDIAENLKLEPETPQALLEISRLTPREAFECYCQWQGLIGGWGDMLASAIDNIRAAEMPDE